MAAPISEIRHLDMHDAPFFEVRRSLGLVWVNEYCSFADGECDVVEHGPFMDMADAFDQCGRPADWRVF